MNSERGGYGQQTAGIGQDVRQLLRQLDSEMTEGPFRERVRQSLEQLADLKLALDESTIVAVTDRRGRITFVNDPFCRISQYSREELLGQDHRIINSGYHGKPFMKQLWQTISSGGIWRGEIKNRAKDGSFYWVNTTIVPFRDEAGQPYQYLSVRNEVTQLKLAEEELQRMMTRVMDIQEEERRRFSRELHDGIGQSLFSLLIQLDQHIAKSGGSELERLRQDVSALMEDVRGLAWEIRPSVLDDLGIVPAVRSYLVNYTRHYGIEVKLDCTLRQRLDVQKETAMYRIIQEALANVGKYADVSEAAVSIRETADAVVTTIADQGAGFAADRRGQGVGLFSMEERARGAGGRLTVESRPGEGTTVTCVFPLEARRTD